MAFVHPDKDVQTCLLFSGRNLLHIHTLTHSHLPALMHKRTILLSAAEQTLERLCVEHANEEESEQERWGWTATERKRERGESTGSDINSDQLNNEGVLMAFLIITRPADSRCWLTICHSWINAGSTGAEG